MEEPLGLVNIQRFRFSNSDATHIFHAFHEGSDKAYKQLEGLKKGAWDKSEDLEEQLKKRFDKTDVNIAAYDISIEQVIPFFYSFFSFSSASEGGKGPGTLSDYLIRQSRK